MADRVVIGAGYSGASIVTKLLCYPSYRIKKPSILVLDSRQDILYIIFLKMLSLFFLNHDIAFLIRPSLPNHLEITQPAIKGT